MAAELHAYDDDERERILCMAEAFTSDESKRRDIMVASATKVAERSQVISPVLLVVAFGFSLGAYAMFQNVILSGLFLSIPVLKVIGASVATSIRKRRASEDED